MLVLALTVITVHNICCYYHTDALSVTIKPTTVLTDTVTVSPFQDPGPFPPVNIPLTQSWLAPSSQVLSLPATTLLQRAIEAERATWRPYRQSLYALSGLSSVLGPSSLHELLGLNFNNDPDFDGRIDVSPESRVLRRCLKEAFSLGESVQFAAAAAE